MGIHAFIVMLLERAWRPSCLVPQVFFTNVLISYILENVIHEHSKRKIETVKIMQEKVS
jgi:hypothetical protein